jgi:hypothetical protein
MLHYRLYGCGIAGSTSIKGTDVDKGGEIRESAVFMKLYPDIIDSVRV